MAISVKITSATLTEGNPELEWVMPAHSFLSDSSIINYEFSTSWSGASKVTKVEATIEVRNAAGFVGWVLARSDTTTATSGTRSYTGTLFNPILSSGYGPPVTSLSDGSYTVVFHFYVWNGNSGDVAPATSISIKYNTYHAPKVTTFDVYRANASGVRADDGTYLRYSITASTYPIKEDDVAVFRLRYRQTGTSTWTNINVGSGSASVSVSGVQIAGSFPIANSYDFQLVIVDNYTAVSVAKLVPTGSVLMHFKADKSGVAVGKYAETSNMFDVALPSRFGASVTIGKIGDSGPILDVIYPSRFRQTVSFDNPAGVRSNLGFGGLSFPVYTDVRLPLETYCHLPVYLAQGMYDSAVYTPVLINAAPYNYVFQVNQAGYYMMAADLRADTSGSDTNTLAHTNLGIYVISSLSALPTTSVSTVVGGVSAQKLSTGLPTTTYRKFQTYSAGCTTTSTTGMVSNVCYIPAYYYVAFMAYFRYSRKDISLANIGMALLK